MAQVILKNIRKTFRTATRRVEALKNVSLHIKDREFFVILGPSGCGKSTLLNTIAGLEVPDSGEIIIGDKTVFKKNHRSVSLEPHRRNIAMVFQSYALYPHLNVFENIAFPLRMMGKGIKELIAKEKKLSQNLPAGEIHSADKINLERINKKEIEAFIEEKVRAAAKLLEIEELLYSKPAELSGGQRQRVAIARSLVKNPSVLLMDEPLSNLDAKLRLKMRGELKNLQRKTGITVIYVTHDQSEASFLADRIAVMNSGRVEQVGTFEEIYEEPQTYFVATFVGRFIPNSLSITSLYESTETGRELLRNIIQKYGEQLTAVFKAEEISLEEKEDMESKKSLTIKIAKIENPGNPKAGHPTEALLPSGDRIYFFGGNRATTETKILSIKRIHFFLQDGKLAERLIF